MSSAPAQRHDLAPARAFATRPVDLMETKLPPAILAKVGEHLAVSMTALGRLLTGLAHGARDRQAILDAALAESSRLEEFGVRLQETARILAGTGRTTSEPVDLARATGEALDAWTRRVGRTIGEPCDPLAIDIDPAVLAELLHHGIHLALLSGAKVMVEARSAATSPRPVLSIRAAKAGALLRDDTAELDWLLFSQLARAVSLVPQRVVDGHGILLTLTFAPTDDDRIDRVPASPAEVSQTAAPTGHRVLIVEPFDMTRVHASQLLRDVGMRVDSVASIAQARAVLRDGPVDVIVTGIAVSDAACAALIDEMRAAQPRLRVVEIVDDDDAFAFSVPGSDRPARVGRHDIARTLARAVAQELDAA